MMKKTKEAAVEEKPVLEQEAPAPKKSPLHRKAAAKAPAKTPKAKAVKVAGAKSEEVYVQFGGGEWKTSDLVQKVKAAYVAEGHRESGIRQLAVYVKPEEGRAYYVINEKAAGSVEL